MLFLFPVTLLWAQAPVLTVRSGLPCGPAAPAKQVITVNGLYLASFVFPTRFYRSADAVTWSQIDGPAVTGAPALIYGAGLLVCVGDSGKIFTSPDGLAWTRRISGTTAGLRDVQFLQGAFYAVGDSATFLHSADGLTWDVLHTGIGVSSDSYEGIVYGNGFFLINSLHQTNQSTLYRSADLTTGSWTDGTDALPGPLRFLKGLFYFFSSEGTEFSSDGINWGGIGLPASYENPSYPVDGFEDSSNVYLLSFGGGPDDVHGLIYPSSDGITFTYHDDVDVVCSGGLYTGHHYFIYSPSGFGISDDSAHYHALGSNYVGMASGSPGYVGVGYSGWGLNGWDQQGLIGSSPDFLHWTDRMFPTPQNNSVGGVTQQVNGVLYDGTRYVAIGGSSLLTSSDGDAWSDTGTGYGLTTMAYGAGIYVAAGESNSGGGSIYFSADLSNWSTATIPLYLPPYAISRVKFVNGYFFAMGGIGYSFPDAPTPIILLSSDGINWNDISPHLPFIAKSIDDVIYDGTTYYFIGMEADATGQPVGFFSVSKTDLHDSASYGNKGGVTAPPSGALLSSGTFAWSNGQFAGGVTDLNHNNAGYLLYSTDGIHWDNTPLNAATLINSIVAAGDTFRMMGNNNVNVTAVFAGVILPVTLLDLNAIVLNGTTLLTWKTAQEENSSRFVVERSPDGVRWDSIGVVAAAGQSNIVLDYRYVDENPLTGYDYYRLLLVDRDGRSTFSPVKRVQIGQPGMLKVYPNPAKISTLVELPESGEGIASLYNAAGVRVMQQEFNGYTITLILQGLPAGIYHLWVQQNGKQYQEEILH